MEELLGLEELFIALFYGGGIFYVRQKFVKQYKHLTAQSYIKAQSIKKIVKSKTDVALFFTQSRKQNN